MYNFKVIFEQKVLESNRTIENSVMKKIEVASSQFAVIQSVGNTKIS